MSRTRLLVTIAAVVFATADVASACVNTYGTNLGGEKIYVEGGAVGDDIIKGLEFFEPRSFWVKQKQMLASKQLTFRGRNDLAVTMLHLGEVKPALDILLAIERDQPGEFATAGNLGVAYELLGDDQKALQWTREEIKRKPDAHDGTEWLHVRILEAKIALRSDPRWLETHSVLGVDFGTAIIPSLPAKFPVGNAASVTRAIEYQLDERYQFVRKPDAVVGSLLFDWANLLVRTEALENAAALYREALRYGTPRADLAKRRLQRVEQTLRDAQTRAKKS